MSERAVKHVRKTLGERLRNLRKDRGLSQQRLGKRSNLSGKFIGEVERGEKSVSVDSLYHVSVALDVPLGHLTEMNRSRGKGSSNRAEVDKLIALVSEPRKPEQIRRAYQVLKAMFSASR